MIHILSHRRNNRHVFSHRCQTVHEMQGGGNWRDMLTVWFWHMGIRAGPAELSGWGKIYFAWTKSFRDGILPTHSTLRWLISVHRHEGQKMRKHKRLPVSYLSYCGAQISFSTTAAADIQCCFSNLQKWNLIPRGKDTHCRNLFLKVPYFIP